MGFVGREGVCVVSGGGWGGVDIISSNSIIGCCARWGVLGVQQVIIYISYCYHTVWFSGVVFIVVRRRVIYDSPYMRGHKIGSRNRRNVMWQQLLLWYYSTVCNDQSISGGLRSRSIHKTRECWISTGRTHTKQNADGVYPGGSIA